MADVELNSIGNGDGTNYLVRDNTKIPLSGTNALSGSIVPSTDNAYDLGGSNSKLRYVYTYRIVTSDELSLVHSNDNESTTISGGIDADSASLSLCGKNYSYLNRYGNFLLRAKDDTSLSILQGTPSGTLTWGSKNVAMQEDVVPRSGGAVMTGNSIRPTRDNIEFIIGGGTDQTSGYISIYGKDFSSYSLNGALRFIPTRGKMQKDMQVKPDGTWVWDGTACQITSDQRFKQQISEIDDKLLDAWEDVTLCQFKYNDAVEQKGKDNARLHTGYVVQQIDSACKSHNVDISEYGLYCHEEYPQQTEEVEVENEDGTTTKETKVIREASEHYSLRYTEALIVECAYLRKKNKDLQEQLNALSERLEKLENR